ncbi:leader peptide SpeFL [Plesiomonas sp.]|uniref:leader peptide SpeFL n=2 Tax=Plesiomonas sp. TaxID=2486279 RepID=UPI003F3ECAC7
MVKYSMYFYYEPIVNHRYSGGDVKGLSIMKHIRRTRHLMMPVYRSYFSFAFFICR